MAKTKTHATDLIAALKGASATDVTKIDEEIVTLDERINQLKNERGSLAAAKKLLELRFDGKPIVGGPRNPKLRAERLDQVYTYLDAEGPAMPAQIAKATGVPIGSMAALLKHEWFKRVGDGYRVAMQRD